VIRRIPYLLFPQKKIYPFFAKIFSNPKSNLYLCLFRYFIAFLCVSIEFGTNAHRRIDFNAPGFRKDLLRKPEGTLSFRVEVL
jgi:hypothetical protein